MIDAHREQPWPDLDSFIDYGNRRAMVARWAGHLARVARSPECTSHDVQAAADRLLPLLVEAGR